MATEDSFHPKCILNLRRYDVSSFPLDSYPNGMKHSQLVVKCTIETRVEPFLRASLNEVDNILGFTVRFQYSVNGTQDVLDSSARAKLAISSSYLYYKSRKPVIEDIDKVHFLQ